MRKKQKTPSSRSPLLVVGLRNPGPDYEGTRHNVGFEALRAVAARHQRQLRRGPLRLRCEVAELRVGPERVVLAAPLSFMNEVGGPVKAALRYFKVDLSDVLVLHDDIDLGFGRLRIQSGGGSGGHNGIRSLERALGSREFARLKIGVGRPPGQMDPADHVLRPFTKKERPEVDLLVEDAVDVIERWVDDRERAQEQAALRRLAE